MPKDRMVIAISNFIRLFYSLPLMEMRVRNTNVLWDTKRMEHHGDTHHRHESIRGGGFKLSLDRLRFIGDHSAMSLYSYQLYSERLDGARNMARYYMLSIQPTLFGEAAVIRTWGRIGKSGGEKSELFETERHAESLVWLSWFEATD